MLSRGAELRVMAYIIQSIHRLYLLLAALLKLVAGRVQSFKYGEQTFCRHGISVSPKLWLIFCDAFFAGSYKGILGPGSPRFLSATLSKSESIANWYNCLKGNCFLPEAAKSLSLTTIERQRHATGSIFTAYVQSRSSTASTPSDTCHGERSPTERQRREDKVEPSMHFVFRVPLPLSMLVLASC